MKLQPKRLSATLALVAPVMALAVAETKAGTDMFLKIDGIEGEVAHDQYLKFMDIASFSWGVSNTGSMAAGSGGGAGKASFSDLSFSMKLDKSSPLLMLACATGQHIPTATLRVVKQAPDGSPGNEYYTITMKEVFISACATGGSSSDEGLTSTVKFSFEKIRFDYVARSATGATETVTSELTRPAQ